MAGAGRTSGAGLRELRYRPPQRAQVVARERLFAQIDRGRRRQGVWITAPAGYGKTTLAGDYLRHRAVPPVWYHLEPEDADPAVFLGRLSRALKPMLACGPLPSLTVEHLANLDAFARYYFAELDPYLPDATLIVLDNYHQITGDSPVHKLLAHGLGRLPAGSWLVSSRRPPPSALAGLLGRGDLALVTAQDLRLTRGETEGLVARLTEGGLTDVDVDVVHERADGWPAGVVLLLHQRRLAPHAASDDGLVFEYLAGQVLGELADEVRRFLLSTAWLPEVTAADAALLSGRAEAEVLLERLVAEHALIERMPGETQAYRYHRLLVDVLRREADEALGADTVRQLKHRSALLLAERSPDVAIEYLVEIGAHDDLLGVVARHAEADLARGQYQRVAGWLAKIPEDLAQRSPWVQYWLGLCETPYRSLAARRHLHQALAGFETEGDGAGCYLAWAALMAIHGLEWSTRPELDRWLAELERLEQRFAVPDDPALQALLVSGRYTALLWSMREDDDFGALDAAALELIESDAVSPTVCGSLALSYLIRHVWHLGDGAAAARVVGRVAGLLEQMPLVVRGSLEVLTEGYRLWFDFAPPPADAGVAGVLERVTETRLDVLLPLIHSQRAYTLLCLGRTEAARAALEQMAAHTPPHRVHEIVHCRLIGSWERLQAGDAEGARTLLADEVLPSYRLHAPGEAIGQVLYGAALHRLGARREGLVALARGRRICRRIGSADLELVARLYLAQMADRAGSTARAGRVLASALALGRSGGFARAPFVSPDELADLCGLALEHGIEADYVSRLIAANRLEPPAGRVNERWPWPVRIRALGGLEVDVNGERLTLATGAQEKPLALLRLMIASAGDTVPLESAADALWPEADGDRALASLKTTLHRLRSLVGGRAVLQRHNRLRLSPEHVWVDADAFERLLDGFERTGDGRALERAVGLYRGPLLADSGDGPLIERARLRLAGRYVGAVLGECDRRLAAGRPLEALATCRSAIDIEPESVALQQRYQNLCLDLGRPAEAVDAYRRYAALLARVNGGAPPRALTEPLADWL